MNTSRIASWSYSATRPTDLFPTIPLLADVTWPCTPFASLLSSELNPRAASVTNLHSSWWGIAIELPDWHIPWYIVLLKMWTLESIDSDSIFTVWWTSVSLFATPIPRGVFREEMTLACNGVSNVGLIALMSSSSKKLRVSHLRYECSYTFTSVILLI